MMEELNEYWSRELNQEIEIVPRGWANSPTDYALYIDGTYVVSYKNVEEIEDYLGRYFVRVGVS